MTTMNRRAVLAGIAAIPIAAPALASSPALGPNDRTIIEAEREYVRLMPLALDAQDRADLADYAANLAELTAEAERLRAAAWTAYERIVATPADSVIGMAVKLHRMALTYEPMAGTHGEWLTAEQAYDPKLAPENGIALALSAWADVMRLAGLPLPKGGSDYRQVCGIGGAA